MNGATGAGGREMHLIPEKSERVKKGHKKGHNGKMQDVAGISAEPLAIGLIAAGIFVLAVLILVWFFLYRCQRAAQPRARDVDEDDSDEILDGLLSSDESSEDERENDHDDSNNILVRTWLVEHEMSFVAACAVVSRMSMLEVRKNLRSGRGIPGVDLFLLSAVSIDTLL